MSDLVPEGWRAAKFVDVFDNYKYGPRFSSKDYADNGNVRTIRGTDVSTSGEIQYAQVLIATIKQDVVDAHSLKQNDLVMITTADCGATAVFNKQNIPYIASAYAIKLTPTKKIESKYILYFMQTPEAKRQVDSLVRKGTVANLPGSDVMNLRFMCPPLPEQQKIAAILSSVDEVIEKTQAQINKLKDLKTGMMQELLSPREGQAANINNPQGESKNSLHHTEFKDSPLGRIPVGWDVVRFNDVLEKIDSGWSPSCIEIPPSSGEWGVLKVSAVTRGKFLEGQSKTLPDNLEPRANIRVRAGDILLTRANGVADLVGKCVMINQEPKSKLMMSDKILRLTPNSLIFDEFLLHTFNSQVTRRQIELSWGGSSGQKNIGQADIKNYRLALPSYEEQKVIARSISQVDYLLHERSKKRDSLNHLKKALMQDLLTGKVRI